MTSDGAPKTPDPAPRGHAERVAEMQAAGVIVDDPASTHLGPEVRVEAGARIRPFTVLEGRSVVRGGAVVKE